jgi:F-type H+-transporting ATPase subunit b
VAFHWESTVFAIVAFLILYLLLSKFAFGPLFGVMEKRAQLVKDQMSSAEESRKQAEQYLVQQKQAIEEARKEAYQIIEQAKTTSSHQAEQILEQARTEAGRLKEEALRDIESEKVKAIAALRSQVSGMSVLIASKVIEKQLDEASQKEIIDTYLKEVGERA